MFLLILDSLGTSETLFILVVALVFLGPRKLPQISRQIGKSLAEFRKASDDFKRTWEREISIETTQPEPELNRSIMPRDNSIIETTVERSQAIDSASNSVDEPGSIADSTASTTPAEPAQSAPTRKQDWL